MNPADYVPRDYRWSQNDLRWKFLKIGISGLTFGNYGCALTAINYVFNRENLRRGLPRPFTRPNDFLSWINKKAKAAFYGNYLTPGGKVYWNCLEEYSGGWLKHQMHPLVQGEKGYTLQEVVWGTYHHWIVLLDGDLCIDPWDGVIKYRKQAKWYPSGRYQYYKQV